MLTCCLLLTIITVMVMGIGIGYHYCFVSNSVESMGKYYFIISYRYKTPIGKLVPFSYDSAEPIYFLLSHLTRFLSFVFQQRLQKQPGLYGQGPRRRPVTWCGHSTRPSSEASLIDWRVVNSQALLLKTTLTATYIPTTHKTTQLTKAFIKTLQ